MTHPGLRPFGETAELALREDFLGSWAFRKNSIALSSMRLMLFSFCVSPTARSRFRRSGLTVALISFLFRACGFFFSMAHKCSAGACFDNNGN